MIGDGVIAYSIPNQSPIDLPILGLSKLGANIKIQLEADNISNKSYTIDYHIEKFRNMEELIDWYKFFYAKALVVRRRELMSMPAYLFNLIFNREEEVAYFSAPDYQIASTPQGDLWIP